MICEAVGPVKFARFTVNAAAANEIVAAVANKKIRVLGMVIANNAAAADVVVTVQDDTSSPVIMIGPMLLPAGNNIVMPTNGIGYGETSKGKALDLLSDGTEVVAGCVAYQLVG